MPKSPLRHARQLSSGAGLARMFSAPRVNIYSEDVESAVEFYRRVGFEETFRTPQGGPPIHVELGPDGFTVADPDSNPIELVQRLA